MYKHTCQICGTELIRKKLYVSAEERDAIKAYAESLGMSVNKLLLTALEEYQKNHS